MYHEKFNSGRLSEYLGIFRSERALISILGCRSALIRNTFASGSGMGEIPEEWAFGNGAQIFKLGEKSLAHSPNQKHQFLHENERF